LQKLNAFLVETQAMLRIVDIIKKNIYTVLILTQ